MKLGIMQPYFFPYIGYFQLITTVDMFIIYDNVKYTKKGWINRNRMLQNDKDVMFSLPLKNDSDYLNVCKRELAADFNRDKLLNQIKGAYRRAPYFAQTFPLMKTRTCFASYTTPSSRPASIWGSRQRLESLLASPSTMV
jgi:hypothetical protein